MEPKMRLFTFTAFRSECRAADGEVMASTTEQAIALIQERHRVHDLWFDGVADCTMIQTIQVWDEQENISIDFDVTPLL